MTTTATGIGVELDSPGEVLTFARDRRAAAEAAETEVLVAAAVWADQHPAESIHEAAVWAGGEHGIAIAGAGAPLVAEFCIPEFAAAIGVSTDSGRAYVGAAVELAHRLPRVWARVRAGDLPAWRAQRIAEATMSLSREGAGFVDAQVAPFAHRLGPAAVERLVAEAIARFEPARARQEALDAAEGRRFEILHQQVSFAGTCRVEGELDLADALDLDAALAGEAASLAAAGCDQSLDVRRSMAAGVIARRQLALDLAAGCDEVGGEQRVGRQGVGEHRVREVTALSVPDLASAEPAGRRGLLSQRGRRPRQVVLYVHLSAEALGGQHRDRLDLARVENRQRVVTADQVRAWCGSPDAQVVVKPVIDLNEKVAVDAYEVPDRLAEQIALRDRHCVFPWCTRPARSCDTDHVIPYQRGGSDTPDGRPPGQTASDNLAPLCRRHHRLKTHSAWRYTMLEPGSYLWASPHGYAFLVDHTGTRDLSHDRPPSDQSEQSGLLNPPTQPDS